jgi:hypothetical protein
VSTLGETFFVEQKMKRIPLIEGFQNMWVICCNGVCGGDTWQVGRDTWWGQGARAPREGSARFYSPAGRQTIKNFVLPLFHIVKLSSIAHIHLEVNDYIYIYEKSVQAVLKLVSVCHLGP